MTTLAAPNTDLLSQFVENNPNEVIRQRVQQRLRLIKGEYSGNPNLGVDYFGKIFGKRDRLVALKEIERNILSVDGVVSIHQVVVQLRTGRRLFIYVEYCTCFNIVVTDQFILPFVQDPPDLTPGIPGEVPGRPTFTFRIGPIRGTI